MIASWQFTKGLHAVGNGCWAYLLPDGGWGWSNAGLITDGDESLLVDTLYDLKHTAEMLGLMRDAAPAAVKIDTLVNTHADGDHIYGNQVVKGARVITTKAVSDRMSTQAGEDVYALIAEMDKVGQGGDFIREVMADFDWHGIKVLPADQTFCGKIDLQVGAKSVKLVDVGPAHTSSDVLIHVPDDRIVYTGDILFEQIHPAIWVGPLRNWVKACDVILDWDVDIVVPGHGPITDKQGVRAFRGYLEWFESEARRRYDAGLSFYDAAYDIDLGPYADWGNSERIIPNLMTMYAQFSGGKPGASLAELFDAMARFVTHRKATADSSGVCAQHHHKH